VHHGFNRAGVFAFNIPGYGMVLAANNSTATDAPALVAELHAAKATLDASRPTAVNLMWATSRMMGLTELLAKGGLGVQAIREKLLEEAETLAQDDIALNKRIGLYGSEVVPHGANILHHCNTGTIATVQYGTAIGVRARVGDAWIRGRNSWLDLPHRTQSRQRTRGRIGWLIMLNRTHCICTTELDVRVWCARSSTPAMLKAKTFMCGWMKHGHGCKGPS
jgi:hypothetical protein